MTIEELEQEVKNKFEPQKKIVEDKLDEWVVVMKETTITLTNWDTETEEGLELIDETEEKQVLILFKICTFGKYNDHNSTLDNSTLYFAIHSPVQGQCEYAYINSLGTGSLGN